MQLPFSQNELTPKRWLMLAGSFESSHRDDVPEAKTTQTEDQKKKAALADLAGRVEANQDDQVDQNKEELAASEVIENAEDTNDEIVEGVIKTLERDPRLVGKLDPTDPDQGKILQKAVEKSSQKAAVDQLGNDELTQRWEQDLVPLTRSQMQDIEPGALAV
jgi:hypothetical protein